MKQKAFSVLLMVVAFFLSTDQVFAADCTTVGTSCSVGGVAGTCKQNVEIDGLYCDPTALGNTSGQPIGYGCLYNTDCASNRCDGPTGKCIAAANTSGQVVGAGCLYPTDCASGICDGATGTCVSSPVPPPSGGSGGSVGGGAGSGSGGAGSGGGAPNRPPVTSGASASGLYIPTRADTGLSDMKVTDLIRNLMLWLLYIVGFIAIIAFVISGIQYLLAGASEEMAKKAKENMQYALIGVIVALSALIIIRAVQSVLLGASIF